MKALYRVHYEVLSIDDGDEKTRTWQKQDAVTVVADADARSAIAKIEKKMVPSSFRWEGDEGEKHETKNIGFRLIGVEHLHDIDHP